MSIPNKYLKNFFGICHGKRYEEFVNIGCHWDRSDFRMWDKVQKSSNSIFQKWDKKIEEAKEYEVNNLFLMDVNYVPDWAGQEGKSYSTPRSLLSMKNNLEQIISHYTGSPFEVKFFEVANEPNIAKYWKGKKAKKRHLEFIEKILKPTAAIIHKYGGEVVAPSITLEWPNESWLKGEDPQESFNLKENKKTIYNWLEFSEAWKYIDYFSLHYAKGDSEKLSVPHADNLMPVFDYIFDNWVKPGKIKGIWNTEEGLTARGAGSEGFNISLEQWEVKPYSQWIICYIIPFLYWTLKKGWDSPHQYKLFWYHLQGEGILKPTCLVSENGKLTNTGKAMSILINLFTQANNIGIYNNSVKLGFGIYSVNYYFKKEEENNSYQFRTYTFTLDEDLLLVSWFDLPGLESEGPYIQGLIKNFDLKSPAEIVMIDYKNGKETELSFKQKGKTLYFELPRTGEPVVYIKVKI